ncbi:MAG: DHH family phosphoesterase [Evtepia sp.]
MNKIYRLLEPGFRLYFTFSLLFAGVTAFFSPFIGAIEALASLGLYLYLQAGISKRKHDMIDYIESMSTNIENANKGSLANSPLPIVIFRPDTDDVIWSNDHFLNLTGDRDHLFDTKLTSIVPSFETRWLMEGKTLCPDRIVVRNRHYLVFGNLVHTDSEGGYLATTYWVEITEFSQIAEKYNNSRPMVAILLLDNYEDLVRGLEDSTRAVLLSEINQRISAWADPAQGLLCRYDRDHYLFVFEAEQLAALQQQKFSLLESVRQIVSLNGIAATLSIGIGRDAPSFRELFHYATLATEMALSRGGDQVAIKDGNDFQFFGGKAKESERRTKVKSRVIANALSELFSNASHILVMGHTFPDLDVIGAGVGVCAIARKRHIPARIICPPPPYPAEILKKQLVSFPEYQNAFIFPEDALLLVDANTILVVVDTNRPEQVLSKELLAACGKIVIIDHHRRAASYISNPILSFQDPYASSASELAAELVQYILEPGDLLRCEAEAILAGIVLDTKNFTARTGGRTFETAAFLRRAGADTADVKKLFQNDLDGTIERYEIIRKADLYRKNIAIAAVPQTVSRIIAAQAADELLGISGIETSFVLFPDKDSVFVSARSASDTNVQVILEKLGGGGNTATAGAQIMDQSIDAATTALKAAIDAYFDEDI